MKTVTLTTDKLLAVCDEAETAGYNRVLSRTGHNSFLRANLKGRHTVEVEEVVKTKKKDRVARCRVLLSLKTGKAVPIQLDLSKDILKLAKGD